MKLFKLSKELYAEPALQEDAECVIGRKINNLVHGNAGYITKLPSSGELDWMPKSEFDSQASVIDSDIDKEREFLSMIERRIEFLSTISKKSGRNPAMRNRAYMAIRRLKALKIDIEKIIAFELLDI